MRPDSSISGRRLSGQETELFAIVWLKRGIVIETESRQRTRYLSFDGRHRKDFGCFSREIPNDQSRLDGTPVRQDAADMPNLFALMSDGSDHPSFGATMKGRTGGLEGEGSPEVGLPSLTGCSILGSLLGL